MTPTPPARLLLALLLSVVLAACAGDDAPSAAPVPPPASATAGDESADEADGQGPPHAVGRRDLTLVDSARGTDPVEAADLGARPDRTLEVIVTYPAAGGPGPEPRVAAEWDHAGGEDEERVAAVDAPPAAGPFPLVVFAHGWNGQGTSFVPLAEQWARAGYVVALPTFPLSRNGVGHGDDYVNQPDDLAFVIDELAGASGDDPLVGPLAGLVDGERVAIGGHSLGSATVFRAAYNACCAIDGVDAVVAVAGGPLDIAEPGYGDQPDTPLLLAHGVADPGVPVGVSDAMVDFVTAPVTYLRLADADHTSLFVGDDGELLSTVALAFLDAHLRDDPAALDDLAAVVEGHGGAELRTG